jgi:drug/metabolite transporter (DMT)-like permease
LIGEGAHLDVTAYDTRSYFGLAYLIVFGSIVAYPAYAFLLQNAPISKVSTYAYVNPVVAVVLGAVLLQERVDASMLIGATIVIAAVAIIVTSDARSGPPADPDPVATDASDAELRPGPVAGVSAATRPDPAV